MTSRLYAVALLVFALALAGNGKATAMDEAYITGDKAWDKCASLQEEWLRALYDIVLANKPRLKGSADLSLKWRSAALKVNSLKFKYLLKTDPGRIIRDKGLKSFVGLNWFWHDSRDLGKANPDFLALESSVKKLEKEHASHPDWPELKSYLRTLAKSEAHTEKFNKFLSDLTGAMRDSGPDKVSAQ